MTYFNRPLRVPSLYLVFKFIRFCTYLAPVHTVSFLYKNGKKIVQFCAFILFTKTEENISIFVTYSFSHHSAFVKLHNRTEALKLISPEQLIATNSWNGKTGTIRCFQSYRPSFFAN